MSDIEFNCPLCAHSLVVDAEGAGTTVDCPKCSKPIQIPAPEEPEEPDKHRGSTLAASVSSQPVAAPPTYRPRLSLKACLALAVGFFGFCFPPLGILAINRGRLARAEILNSQGRLRGAGMALAGQVLGYIVAIPLFPIAVALIISAFHTSERTYATFDGVHGQRNSQGVMAEVPAQPPVAGENQSKIWALDICGKKTVQNPSEEDIRSAVLALDTKKRDAFLVLSQTSDTFMQTCGDAIDGFVLEYREGDNKHHFQAKRSFTADEIVKAFTSYMSGATDWKEGTTWGRWPAEVGEADRFSEGQTTAQQEKPPPTQKQARIPSRLASDETIERVKNGALEFDTSVKVGKVMDGYKYFTNVTWRSFETKQGRKVVEMSGPMNLDAYKGAKYGTDLDGITLPDKNDVRWSRIKDWKMTYVARFHLSQTDDTFEIAYAGLSVVVKMGGEEKTLDIEDKDFVSLKNIYKDEPAAAAVAFFVPFVLGSEPNAADRRMAEELAAGTENRKAEVARAQTQIADLRNQLAVAVEEEKKELEQVETKFTSRTALKDEIQSLRLREEEARKQAETLEQQGVPLKKQTEELSAARAVIANHYQPYVEKAQTNAKNARDAADKNHADTLSAAARLINTAIASHRLSVELVPQDGKYGNAMFEGKSSGFSSEVFETKDEVADIGNAMVAAQVGDMLPTQDGTLAVVTGRGAVQFGQNQIRYKVFGRFPKELADPVARQSFVRMYWGYVRNLPAYETAARTAQAQLATTESQAKQAIDNWDAQNGPKLKTMQEQVSALASQMTDLNSKLSKDIAERTAKEAILNKPQAEQLTAMRDEIKARYAEKRRPLEEQVASLEAKLKAQSVP